MSIDALLDSILPGYQLLETEDRSTFEQTELGKNFAALSEQLSQPRDNGTVLNNLCELLLLGADSEHPAVTETNTQNLEQLIAQFKESLAYTELKTKIDQKILSNLIDRSKLLTYHLPLLTPALDPLVANYHNSIKQAGFNASKIELDFISDLIANELNNAFQQLYEFLATEKLNEFHQKQAPLLAQKIIDKFATRRPLSRDELFDDYKNNLLVFVHDQLVSTPNKPYVNEETTYLNNLYALSNAFWNSSPIAQSKQYFVKLSEARPLLVKAGLIGQNDNMVAAMLDWYYIHKVKDDVIDYKRVLGKFLTPFKPLFDEFKHIAANESNPILLLVRIIIPLGIILGFIIGICFLLAPLAIPEAVIAVIIIPVLLYIGMGIASTYVYLKNEVVRGFCIFYYGGPYETPSYQVNNRMIHAFKNLDNAQSVRDYYVDQLQQCDAIEEEFKRKDLDKSLDELDLEQRLQNYQRGIALITEWNDIHSNSKLGYTKTPAIVLRRMGQDLESSLEQMDKIWQAQDAQPVELMVNLTVKEIAPHFIGTLYPSSPNPQRHLFFKPFCLTHKENAEKLDSMMTQLRR